MVEFIEGFALASCAVLLIVAIAVVIYGFRHKEDQSGSR